MREKPPPRVQAGTSQLIQAERQFGYLKQDMLEGDNLEGARWRIHRSDLATIKALLDREPYYRRVAQIGDKRSHICGIPITVVTDPEAYGQGPLLFWRPSTERLGMPPAQQLASAEAQIRPVAATSSTRRLTLDPELAVWRIHPKDFYALKWSRLGRSDALEFEPTPKLYRVEITVVDDLALEGLGPKLYWRT